MARLASSRPALITAASARAVRACFARRRSPPRGSRANILHNLFCAGEYLGGAAAFALLRAEPFWGWLGEAGVYASGGILVCLWGISFPHPLRALVQRVAETLVFAGLVLMAWWVYRAST